MEKSRIHRDIINEKAEVRKQVLAEVKALPFIRHGGEEINIPVVALQEHFKYGSCGRCGAKLLA